MLTQYRIIPIGLEIAPEFTSFVAIWKHIAASNYGVDVNRIATMEVKNRRNGDRNRYMQIINTLSRAWIRLPSGRRLDLINPSPDAWLDADLSSRLSRTARWGGESAFDLPLSVAQHSLTVLQLRRQWSGNSLSPRMALKELLHDGEEGFLHFDPISPLKGALGKPFQDIADRLMEAIEIRYQLPDWDQESYSLHKQADWIAAATEAVHCIGWTPEEARDVLGITHPALLEDPLASLYGCKPWEPWPAHIAAERFLNELNHLLELTGLNAAKVA